MRHNIYANQVKERANLRALNTLLFIIGYKCYSQCTSRRPSSRKMKTKGHTAEHC